MKCVNNEEVTELNEMLMELEDLDHFYGLAVRALQDIIKIDNHSKQASIAYEVLAKLSESSVVEDNYEGF